VGEVNLVARGYYAAGAQRKPWIDRVDDLRIGNRVYFVHPDQFRISVHGNFFAAANDIEMSDPDVVPQSNFADANYQVQMHDTYVVLNFALPGVDNAKADAHTFADAITKEQSVGRTQEKRRQEGD